jgi:hypothetical protein
LFSALGISGGRNLVLLETFLLAGFWAVFFREFLFKDEQRLANWLTLVLDVFALIPLLVFISDGNDHKTQLGLLIGFSTVYAIVFLLEFIFVYSGAWRSFMSLTKTLFSE